MLLFLEFDSEYEGSLLRTNSQLVDLGSFCWLKYEATCHDYMYPSHTHEPKLQKATFHKFAFRRLIVRNFSQFYCKKLGFINNFIYGVTV
jgi:hypothetical protein